jgi:hypothetical protein
MNGVSRMVSFAVPLEKGGEGIKLGATLTSLNLRLLILVLDELLEFAVVAGSQARKLFAGDVDGAVGVVHCGGRRRIGDSGRVRLEGGGTRRESCLYAPGQMQCEALREG